jgi:hypothetical protein
MDVDVWQWDVGVGDGGRHLGSKAREGRSLDIEQGSYIQVDLRGGSSKTISEEDGRGERSDAVLL